MARKEPHITFSTYTGAEDLPEDFGSARVRATRQGSAATASAARNKLVTPHKRSGLRFWLLCMMLVSASGLAVHQYAAPINEQWGVSMKLALPELQWPELRMPEMPALDGPMFNRPIRTVRIESAVRRISETDIRAVLARHIDEGFFSIDVRAVKAELEANPWVDQASVRRVWPDGLAVTVHEQQPIARWGDTELLNFYAERFTPADMDRVEALPVLSGPAQQEEVMMRQYQQFSQMLLASGLRIRALTLSERGSWSMEVDNGIRLEIGREQLTERMQRFVSLYDRALYRQADEISVIDLRYRNGLAVRSRESGTGEVASL